MSDKETEKKPINVCLVDAPPFVYKDELGNYKGIEYDVFNSFAKEAKLKVRFMRWLLLISFLVPFLFSARV